MSRSNAFPAIWSMEIPFSSWLSDFLICTPVRYEPEAREWSPPPSPSASDSSAKRPVTTINCSRNGFNPASVGENSKLAPVPVGNHLS